MEVPFWLHLIWFTWFIYHFNHNHAYTPSFVEMEHNYDYYKPTISPFILGTDIQVPDKEFVSPDFRIEEPLWLPRPKSKYGEENRPYRISPHYKTTYRFRYFVSDENVETYSCICTTVYKRLTLLAGCAAITTRHIVTTASSTWLVLKPRLKYDTLEDILGIWYDHEKNVYNSSMYMSVSRIHFHPYFHKPEHVNRSHPLPFTFDLAVWALTHTLYGWYTWSGSISVCLRAGSTARYHISPLPTVEMLTIAGYQFMWAYKKKPSPFFKYMFRTLHIAIPCPKSEWGWFICIYSNFLKFGIDSGAPLHRASRGKVWNYDGLIGLGAFSMRLRGQHLNHYFTVLDCHVVLDFFFDTYVNAKKAVWVDARFEDSRGMAPRPKYYIPHYYTIAEQHPFDIPMVK